MNKGPRHKINQYISSNTIRLIDPDNNTNVIITLQEALEIAEEKNTDLVQIADGEVPIVKIIDYDKFLYQLDKNKKENIQHPKKLKQITLSPHIADHDLGYKVKQINEWLEDGSKVQITVKFSGRENQHREFGKEILNKILEQSVGKSESIKDEGNRTTMFLIKK